MVCATRRLADTHTRTYTAVAEQDCCNAKAGCLVEFTTLQAMIQTPVIVITAAAQTQAGSVSPLHLSLTQVCGVDGSGPTHLPVAGPVALPHSAAARQEQQAGDGIQQT